MHPKRSSGREALARGMTAEMRVLYTLMSVSRSAGGVQGAVLNLAQNVRVRRGTGVDVFAPSDEHSQADMRFWEPVVPRLFEVRGPRKFLFSPELSGEMSNAAPDIVHCHGLWIYPNLAATCWARRTRRPMIVSPHGMLEPDWELKKSRLRKLAAYALFQRRQLRRAVCLHALNLNELEHIRRLGLRTPVCVIPNGVNEPEAGDKPDAPWGKAVAAGRRILLYLGRVTPKKGIANLIRAMATLKGEGWSLVVVGWEQEGHRGELQRLADEVGASADVHFMDALFGADKAAAFRNADAFVLPSMSEGLPLVVMEAWSYGLPVVMTPQCNIPEAFTANAAIKADPTAESLRLALQQLFRMSDHDRAEIGARGKRLVAEQFTWSRVAEQMCNVYEWALGGGEVPACVHTT